MLSIASVDENGDPLEVWLVKRAFALLAPVCKLGLVVELCFLFLADPLYFFLDLWSQAVPQGYLMAWHAAMALYFAAVLVLSPRAVNHQQRQHLLQAFFIATALLFVWFGVVSWLGTGDLSMVAIAQVLLASAFSVAGRLRRWLYWLQVLAIGLLLAWLDRSGRFLGQMQFANLPVIAAVAHAMDGYMLDTARALFSEKCRVAQERQRADTVLYNALPPAIAEELKANQHVRAQSHPQMAILFADIVGFTQFSAARTPEQVLAVLNNLFSEMDLLVDLHQVEKIKTIGDAYMVVSATHPEALAALALSMHMMVQRFNAEWGLQLALRIGMHCGPAISGVIGSKRMSYDVWGDAVNLASRMESSGEPGRIQTSEALFQALHDGFDFEARGAVQIKGKGALPTYFLLGAKPVAAP
jgi:class 3 adenylate cyclase